MSDYDRKTLQATDEWNRQRVDACKAWLASRGFSEHHLLDNEEIEIVIASAFNAGARWERDRTC